jgi:hypothetical protein
MSKSENASVEGLIYLRNRLGDAVTIEYILRPNGTIGGWIYKAGASKCVVDSFDESRLALFADGILYARAKKVERAAYAARVAAHRASQVQA